MFTLGADGDSYTTGGFLSLRNMHCSFQRDIIIAVILLRGVPWVSLKGLRNYLFGVTERIFFKINSLLKNLLTNLQKNNSHNLIYTNYVLIDIFKIQSNSVSIPQSKAMPFFIP